MSVSETTTIKTGKVHGIEEERILELCEEEVFEAYKDSLRKHKTTGM